MISQKNVENESDKLTEFSFYLLAFAMGGALLFVIGFFIYSFLF